MKKIKLNENMKAAFLKYSNARKNHDINHSYNYLNNDILLKTFDYMLKHRLTVEENAKTYIYKNNKRDMLCCGYSGSDINCRDDESEMVDNLFHEILCKAEWIARSKIQSYTLIVKQDIGTINYNYILSL